MKIDKRDIKQPEWEYKVIETSQFLPHDLEKFLNCLGEGGWRLVGVENKLGFLMRRKSPILWSFDDSGQILDS